MQKAIQTQTNAQRLPFFDKRIPYSRLSIKEKAKHRVTRASKNVKKYFIEKEQGWDSSFMTGKIPLNIEPIISRPKRLHSRRSESLNVLNTSETKRKPPSEMKFRIHRMSSPHNNLYSVREVPPHGKVTRVMQQTSCAEIIKILEENIVKIYELKQIPVFHRNIIAQIRSGIENEGVEIKVLKEELRDLKSPVSKIHAAKMACEEREAVLGFIFEVIKETLLKEEKPSRLKNLPDMIRQLRNHSLNCIQKILKWRQHLAVLQADIDPSKRINPVYGEQSNNYLLKMLEDTQFLHDSQLFPKSSFPDPFLLSYDKDLILDMKKYSKIRACQLFLLQQSL